MAYWLFKTEPDVFGLQDIARAPNKTARWDEIRNYQARNFLRDGVKKDDWVFIYHSQCKPTAIVGLARVAREAYPDPSQFNPSSDYFDPKSTADNPRWYCVDITYSAEFAKPLTLATIKKTESLGNLLLLKQGRLSVQPVDEEDATRILALTR